MIIQNRFKNFAQHLLSRYFIGLVFQITILFIIFSIILMILESKTALSFDPSYVYYSNQGINGFLGLRYHIK